MKHAANISSKRQWNGQWNRSWIDRGHNPDILFRRRSRNGDREMVNGMDVGARIRETHWRKHKR